MPTARQLRTFAAQARRDAADWRARADVADEQARELERLAAMVDRSGLPNTGNHRSIVGSKMQLQNAPTTKKMRIAASRTKRAHPAKKIWLESGRTDKDIAKEVGVGRSTVSAWMAEPGTDGFRPIPRRLAERFLRDDKIPLEAWARIAG
jgi:hypothetical protein